MQNVSGNKAVKLGIALALTAGLMACQSHSNGLTAVKPDKGQAESSAASGTQASGERRLTVVKNNGKLQNEEVAVARIHRLEGAHITSWLSDDEVKITTTRLIKASTSTEDAQYAYSTSIVDLLTDEPQAMKVQQEKSDASMIVKEQISPDGQHSFIQKWPDKYTARNYIKNTSTGESMEIQIHNYMESGGWLDKDTYILAAGSMKDRGDILSISMDGRVTPVQLEDPDVLEMFRLFKVSHGSIYYTDKNQSLKRFEPGQSHPTMLIQHTDQFEISPQGEQIAISTAYAKGVAGTKLLIYDAKGTAQGALIGKGDLIPYINWSPDGSKLAFAVYTEEKSGMNGVYLFDSATGKVSPIGPYYFPQYPLSWNPSGTRLGVTIAGDDDLPVTQIIDFK